MKMEAFDRLNFYQNYRQLYTVIPITTVRGPSLVGHHICYKISFRTSRKNIKCPNRGFGVLSNSHGLCFLAV